ncbi:transketolase family protein [Candidatus Nomurabacteria bacterium]|nr:transketolase family protein [Candidatus Nomurabacteria bacterium]
MTNNNSQKNNLRSTRDAYGEALLSLAKTNKNIIAVSADLAESTRLQDFAKKYPERLIEVGVAEQNMLGVAAGLALSNKTVFASSFAVFSPGRNWEQLRISVCYSKANVKLVSTHAGLSVGADGATHQALEDLALTRVLPNLIVISPSDYQETKKAVVAIAKINNPVYLRLHRQESEQITTSKSPFKIGKANILQKGNQVTLVACGPILSEAIAAVKKSKISVEIINCHTIKPLDKNTILKSLKKTKRLITLEEHQVAGGLGSAILEEVVAQFPVPVEMIGVQDSFGESGKVVELWKKYKIDRNYIETIIKKIITRK